MDGHKDLQMDMPEFSKSISSSSPSDDLQLENVKDVV